MIYRVDKLVFHILFFISILSIYQVTLGGAMQYRDAKEYKMFEEELDVIQTDKLIPELLRVYNLVLPLYRNIDNKFPPNSDMIPPPERSIPILEGDGRNDSMRQEIKYQNNQWHMIFYAERSNHIDRVKSFSDINELALFLTARYAYARAGWVVEEEGNDFDVLRQNELKIEIVSSINQVWGERLKSGEKLGLFYEGGD